MFKPILSPVTPNTNPADYHAIGKDIPKGDPSFVVSRSMLADFGRNPSKWKNAPPQKATKAMKWGDVMDCLLFTPELFDKRFAIAPETYPCEPTKKDPRSEKPWTYQATHCKEWREGQEATGFVVIDSDDYAAAQVAMKRLMEDEIIAEVRKSSDVQVQVRVEWHCPHTGLIIPVKVLADMVAKPNSKYGRGVFDFKTACDASVDAWSRAMFDQEYYYQAAFYLDAINCATGLEYELFGNLVQESSAPYETARRAIDEEFIKLGRQRYVSDFAAYAFSLKNDKWPGYDERDLNNTEHPVMDGFRLMSPAKWMLAKSSF